MRLLEGAVEGSVEGSVEGAVEGAVEGSVEGLLRRGAVAAIARSVRSRIGLAQRKASSPHAGTGGCTRTGSCQ